MYQINRNKGEEILVPDATTTDAGLYATTDYHYTKDSYWQAGIRLDSRFINGDTHGEVDDEKYIPSFSKRYIAFIFSTGIYQRLAEHFSLRTSLSSGYRAPNMFELLSNGVHEGTNRFEIGDQELRTENSYQVDLSLDYRTDHVDFFVNPYFNYIRDYIFLKPSGEIRENLPVYYYRQANVYLFGGETGFHFHPHPLDWLHLQASYSNTYGQDTYNQDLPLMPSSKINSTASANFSGEKAIRKFSIFLQYQYSFKQNHIAEYETPTDAYSVTNAGIYVEFKINRYRLLANAAVNNLFNKCYYDHLSRYKTEEIYNMGRNIVFKLTIPVDVAL
jgi:iron complex outermembrane receptor protein